MKLISITRTENYKQVIFTVGMWPMKRQHTAYVSHHKMACETYSIDSNELNLLNEQISANRMQEGFFKEVGDL